MARKKQNDQTFETVRHFPVKPFGRHAGKRCFELRVATNHDGPRVPLSGCTLTEPIGDDGKDLLVRMGLARFDGGGRFEVDFPALRAHLQGVLHWSDTTIAGATWVTILHALRQHEHRQAEQPPDGDSLLSPAQLAKRFALPAESLRKRLERLRARDLASFVETENAGNEPRFLYRLRAVLPIIEKMRGTDETSR